LPFPVTLDLDKKIMNSFDNVKLTPTSVLVDKKGRVINTIIGVLDFQELHEKIDQMLKN
jgi:protein-disulfide isomerase